MATYLELRNAFNDSGVQNKAEAAIADVMVDVLERNDTDANGYTVRAGSDYDTDHAKRLKWVVDNSGHGIRKEAIRILWFVLIKNKAATDAVIRGATTDTFKTQMIPLVTEYAIQAGA